MIKNSLENLSLKSAKINESESISCDVKNIFQYKRVTKWSNISQNQGMKSIKKNVEKLKFGSNDKYG